MTTEYTTYWLDVGSADMANCLAIHQRVFPGNALSTLGGMVKIAVLDGDTPPAGATTVAPPKPQNMAL